MQPQVAAIDDDWSTYGGWSDADILSPSLDNTNFTISNEATSYTDNLLMVSS